ncbi:MAG: LysM peptidoglycan-binding domain-containing protein [Thermogutta sp.]|nr:LysM peptidoglycan-binding domain-containing protein [Thermogutta sp.]
METVKTIAVLAVLLVVGYLGYQAVTKPPKAPPPGGQAADWPADGDLEIAVPEVPMEVAGGNFQDAGRSAETGPAVPPAAIAGPPPISPGSESGEGGSGFLAAEPQGQVGRFATMGPSSLSAQDGSRGDPASGATPRQEGASSSHSPISSAFQSSSPEMQSPPAGTPVENVRKEFAEFLETARRKLDQGDFAAVHQVLSAWFADDRLMPEESRQLTDLLDQVAGTVIYSRQSILEQPHVVAPGETLERIAEGYAVPWPLLAKINGISQPERLAPGQSLKVVRGPFEARIYLSRGELVLFCQDRYAGRFRVTLGADAAAAPGVYRVCEKIENPAFYTPTGVTSPGDSNNPLGQLWIGLGGRLGIHGPGRPDLLQQPNPPGAFILSEKDIQDVYDILSIGSQVAVVP